MKLHSAKRGFTLIELLVVISVIAVLSSIVLGSLNLARVKARNVARKSQMKTLQTVLELYNDTYNHYPITGGVWYTSEPGSNDFSHGPGNDGNWIPDVVAEGLISELPRDPRGGQPSTQGPCLALSVEASYLYRSDDGNGYDLLADCGPEGTWPDTDPFYDPNRPTWAWEICQGADCNH
ncbi:MAG: hypothetical protein K0S38_885 [Candidatus Paceibacter sp.]|nr:hypothetical protein [Candidatus Paceibacter sp.]